MGGPSAASGFTSPIAFRLAGRGPAAGPLPRAVLSAVMTSGQTVRASVMPGRGGRAVRALAGWLVSCDAVPFAGVHA